MAFDLALSNSSMRHIVVAVLGCSHTERYLSYDCNAMIRYDTIRYDTHIIQGVPGRKVNILGGHGIGHSKQKCLYEHVPYSERFPR